MCLPCAGVSDQCEMPHFTELVFIAVKTAMLIGPPSGKDTKMSAHLILKGRLTDKLASGRVLG